MATKALANGGVCLVGGVQAEAGKKLQRNALQVGAELTSKHTWIAIVTKTDASVTKNLIEMVVTTHNDSLLEKPIAWLWPARLLAALHQHQHETFYVTKF